MDWGAVAVIAREVSPGSYTFTVNLLRATEASGGTYVYMAWADQPFVNSEGEPANAR